MAFRSARLLVRAAIISALVFALPFLVLVLAGGVRSSSARGLVAVGVVGVIAFALTGPVRLVARPIFWIIALLGGHAWGWLFNIAMDLLALAIVYEFGALLKIHVVVTSAAVVFVLLVIGVLRTMMRIVLMVVRHDISSWFDT